ncbi:hypothetical protein [Azospirillum himalayense]|uniref:Uncharacterized protein n=1 Tax=Azospirillum himalayense TaxID=654847 RepID=A0ABW0G431_9PROT
MALCKPVATPFGVTATYHHVAVLQTHFREGVCDIVLASYVDEAARRTGCQPLGTLPGLRLTLVELGASAEPSRAAVYAALSGRPEWEGATAG